MDYTHSIEIDGKTIYTTVTAKPAIVGNWIRCINSLYRNKGNIIVGLDAEGKGTPSKRPNRRNPDEKPVVTLQLCVGNRCIIIQLHQIRSIPSSLQRFLTNPRYVFAGVEVEGDAENLKADYGLECGRLYDVRKAALEGWPERFSRCPGLKEVAATVVGVQLAKPKRVTMSDWWTEELSKEQVEYGCLDAYASCRVGVILFFGHDWGLFRG